MSNRLQEELARAGRELGVRVVIGYIACLANRAEIPTQALFPDLGGRLGTVVFESLDACDAETRRELIDEGFSISTISQPSGNQEFDVDSYAEMFEEWGWTSNPLQRPDWMA